MKSCVDHVEGETFHGRRGAPENAFRYAVDYVMVDAEAEIDAPVLFGRGRRRLFALHDRDHGGPPGAGRGARWVRELLSSRGLDDFGIGRIELLAQPRVLGHVFNPVSFWLVRDHGDALRVAIAEVTNTYGDRHSYLCHHDDLRPIAPDDHLRARKALHVSPFQPVEGDYDFRFDIQADRVGIWIDYKTGNGGLVATLTGRRRPLTSRAILRILIKRPFGSRRVLGLIHWQALKLWIKGARFRARPAPPPHETSR